MERIVALVLVFAVSISYGLTETFEGSSGKVTVDNGQVGIGEITGGSFGPGSFSIAGPGGVSHGLPAGAVQHGGPIIINPPQGGVHQGNVPPQNGFNSWNGGQNNQVYPQRPHAQSGHREFVQTTTNGGSGGQGGNFQGSGWHGFQGGQGAGVYPDLGGQGLQAVRLQGGQAAGVQPLQGSGFQGPKGGGFQGGQTASFQAGQSGAFQGAQGATKQPSHGGTGAWSAPTNQGSTCCPGQGGSIQIGSITGGRFEKNPNFGNPSRDVPYSGFNKQLIRGHKGHEEISGESSYSAESAEEPEQWVWAV